jgi:shikimate kinase
VLATGGGMPCFGDNLQKLKDLGVTLYLQRSSKELAHRLINAKNKRPLIEGMAEDELLAFIQSKLQQREEYYKTADIILDREEQNPEVIQRLVDHLLPEQTLQKS